MAMIDAGEASAKEISGKLGLPVPNVSYHIGILRDLGLIKVVRETPRRGAVERHYRTVKQALTARHVVDMVLAADTARPKGWTARTLSLDAKGAAAVDAAIEKLWAEVKRAEARVAKGEGRIRRTLAVVKHDE